MLNFTVKQRDQARVDRIVELGKQHNVCNIKPDPVGGVICNGGRGCCHGCNHLSKNGCTVSAHGCRMWFCETAWLLFPLHARCEIYQLIMDYEGKLYFRHDGWVAEKNFTYKFADPNAKRLIY